MNDSNYLVGKLVLVYAVGAYHGGVVISWDEHWVILEDQNYVTHVKTAEIEAIKISKKVLKGA